MTMNFKLGDVREVDSIQDPMTRSWVGWKPELSDQDTYEQNRGVWFLGRRARNERIATFSHNGAVVAVVAVDHIEDMPKSSGADRAKQAIVGRVLEAGHGDYDALIGQVVDSHRNPVTYGLNPSGQPRSCACGCGGEVAGSRVFLPGHDQRAIHDRIAQEWGSTLGFVEWFDETYGSSREAQVTAAAS
jgi:hypothetical protein